MVKKGTRMSVDTKDHPIFAACESNDVDKVRRILEETPAAVNYQSRRSKQTPLHIAVGRNHYELVELLLTQKDLNGWLEDRRGRVAMEFAYRSYRYMLPMLEAALNPQYEDREREGSDNSNLLAFPNGGPLIGNID